MSAMDLVSHQAIKTTPLALVSLVAGLSLAYFIWRAVYNLYFHPLAHIPGPRLSAVTRWPHIRHIMAGTTAREIDALHRKYGPVVRFTTNEVSFISGETAWQDIYGFRTGKMRGHDSFPKDKVWYAPPIGGVPSLLTANDENHSRMRRVLAHAFSANALHAQENLLQSYVDLLVDRVGEESSGSSKSLDMVYWFNAFTFDVISDLLFGQPFGSLQSGKLHKYIDMLLLSLRGARLHYIMTYWPWTRFLKRFVFDQQLFKARVEYQGWVAAQARQRLARDTARPDFMTYIQKHNDDKPGAGLSSREIEINATLFVVAGSETTATLLSGALFLLLKNPGVMQKLKDEVRGAWQKYDDITIEAVNNHEYLIAVLSEALRYFPPVPVGFQRAAPKGGETVSGYYIPEGMSVSMSSWAAHHSERNFHDPEKFAPERWMGDEVYANDHRSGCQPFSFGPRSCLGKNLAYAEMRLALAKMVWKFDFSLAAESEEWLDNCRVEGLWAKPPLRVHVKNIRE